MNASQRGTADSTRRGVPPWIDLRDRLMIVAAFESAALRQLKIPPLPVYIAVAVLAVVFGSIRAEPSSAAFYNLFEPFYIFLYVESMPLLVIALAAGLLGRTFGLAFFVPFVVVDAIVFQVVGAGGSQAVTHSLGAYLGRVVAVVLLAMLIFLFPAVQRAIAAAARRRGAIAGAIGAAAGAAAVGVLVLAWAVAVPYLVRPIFDNVYMPTYVPSDLQSAGDILALIAFGLAMASGLVLLPRTSPILDGIALAPWASWVDRLGVLRWPLALVATLLLFMGLITTWFDAVILAAGVAAGPLLAPFIARTPPMRWLVANLSLPLRLLAGVLLASGIALIVTRLFYGPALDSEFLPMIITIAVSFPIVTWMAAPPRGQAGAGQAPSAAVGTAAASVVVASVVVGWLVLASPASADNCSGFFDCAYGKLSEWAAAALAFLAAAVAALWAGLKTAVIHPLIPEPLASEEAVDAIRGGVSYWQKMVADHASLSDPEESSRIRNLSPKDFLEEARTGKWDGIGGSLAGGDGGGISISGSGG